MRAHLKRNLTAPILRRKRSARTGATAITATSRTRHIGGGSLEGGAALRVFQLTC